MKRQTLTVLLLTLCSCFVNGQDTITSYFDRNWKKCNGSSPFAVYYRKAYSYDSGMWIVEDYHMNGYLQMKGQFSDKKLKKKHGTFIYYHQNGKVSSSGQCSNNERIGTWKMYFKNGSIAAEGKMSSNKRDSIWTLYHMNGTVLSNLHYS